VWRKGIVKLTPVSKITGTVFRSEVKNSEGSSKGLTLEEKLKSDLGEIRFVDSMIIELILLFTKEQ